MKVVFISNYFNHHQEEFSLVMHELTKGQYFFIAMEPISEERLRLGYEDINEKYPWILKIYKSTAEELKAKRIINEADVVIFGAGRELIEKRLKENKLTFFYRERLEKQKSKWYKFPVRRIKFFFRYKRHKQFYLLCASAYTAADFAKSGTFLNKAYKWGYFPSIKRYKDIGTLIKEKKGASILWVGRLIRLKHPEYVLFLAKKLKSENYTFTINIIGDGPDKEWMKEKIQEFGLEEYVHMLGVMSPQEVRKYMEESEIFLFTSDRNEGWGAVLNESMNSGCAVVASHIIGSVPFLVKHEENGMIFEDQNVEDLYLKTKFLLENKTRRQEIGQKAYETIANQWNAENAAERLLNLSTTILEKKTAQFPYTDGPCSKAERIKDNWFLK